MRLTMKQRQAVTAVRVSSAEIRLTRKINSLNLKISVGKSFLYEFARQRPSLSLWKTREIISVQKRSQLLFSLISS